MVRQQDAALEKAGTRSSTGHVASGAYRPDGGAGSSPFGGDAAGGSPQEAQPYAPRKQAEDRPRKRHALWDRQQEHKEHRRSSIGHLADIFADPGSEARACTQAAVHARTRAHARDRIFDGVSNGMFGAGRFVGGSISRERPLFDFAHQEKHR